MDNIRRLIDIKRAYLEKERQEHAMPLLRIIESENAFKPLYKRIKWLKQELEGINAERLLLAPLSGIDDPFSESYVCNQCVKELPLQFKAAAIRCPSCNMINYLT